MQSLFPIFLSDSASRIFEHSCPPQRGVATVYYRGVATASDKEKVDLCHLTQSGTFVQAISDPPFLFMRKCQTTFINSNKFSEKRSESSEELSESSEDELDEILYQPAPNIIIPSSYLPVLRHDILPGERMIVHVDSLSWACGNSKVDGQIKQGMIESISKNADHKEKEFLKQLVERNVLKPVNPKFCDMTLVPATQDLLCFLDKAYPNRSQILSERKVTLLSAAARVGKWDLCMKLLDTGALPDHGLPAESKTPLHLAAKAGRLDVLEKLLSKGADPNRLTPNTSYRGDKKKLTALTYASGYHEDKKKRTQMI